MYLSADVLTHLSLSSHSSLSQLSLVSLSARTHQPCHFVDLMSRATVPTRHMPLSVDGFGQTSEFH